MSLLQSKVQSFGRLQTSSESRQRKAQSRMNKVASGSDLKSIYLQLVKENETNQYAFGGSGERFSNKAQLEEIGHIRRARNRNRDNLEGGLGPFMTKEYHSRRKGIERKRNGISTERVINPSMNNEVVPPKNKRTFYKLRQASLHSTDGSFNSLIMKTPKSFPVRGKKRCNSVSGKEDHDFFSKEFLMDNKANPIPGIQRKIRRNFSSSSNPITLGNEPCPTSHRKRLLNPNHTKLDLY